MVPPVYVLLYQNAQPMYYIHAPRGREWRGTRLEMSRFNSASNTFKGKPNITGKVGDLNVQNDYMNPENQVL